MTIEEFIANLEKHETRHVRYFTQNNVGYVIVPVTTNRDSGAIGKAVKFVFKPNEETGEKELSNGIVYKESLNDYILHFVDNMIEYGGEDEEFIIDFVISN